MQLLAPALNRAKLEQFDPACQLGRSLGAGETEPRRRAERSHRLAAIGLRRSHRTATTDWHIDGPLVPSLDADLAAAASSFVPSPACTGRGPRDSGEESTFAAEPPRAEDEDVARLRRATAGPQADPLRGAVFGEIVHGVLEKIDYAAVGQAASPELLLAEHSVHGKGPGRAKSSNICRSSPAGCPRTSCARCAGDRVADLVWHALHTPLPELGPLWQVPARDRLVELSFHFPEQEPARKATGQRDERAF